MADLQQLQSTRSRWKASVTRHMNTLERHLAEQNKEAAHKKLDDLKKSFLSFEIAHESYNALLEHEPDVEASDKYFMDHENLYTNIVGRAMLFFEPKDDAKEEVMGPVSQAIDSSLSSTNSHELMMLMNMPRQELEKYDGDPTSYHVFISMFEENVKCLEDDKLKLTHLIQSTTGKAHAAINACALMSGDKGYEQARMVLLERFGNDYIVSERMITNIRSGKQLHSPEDIQQLADDLNQCYLVLKEMGKAQEVESQRCISEVVDRLPKYIRDRWRRQAQDIKDNKRRFPCFEEFMNFVAKEARYSNCPVYGEKARSNNNQSSQSSQPKPKTTSSFSTSAMTKKPKKCILCSQDHNLLYCKRFREMERSQRVQLVSEKGLCEVCLRGNHKTADCNKSYVCSKNGCGKRHSIFLHVDSVQSPSSVQLVNASVSVDADVHMPVVGVRLNGTHEVCALLDTGSSNTFCSKSLVDSLGVVGRNVSCNLNTISRKNESVSTKVVDLQLSSLDGEEGLNLTNVYVIDDLPITTSCPNVKFAHLSGLQFVGGGQKVQLLLGQDNAEALVPLEVKQGKVGEPFASRTLFGWSLNGTSGPNGTGGKVFSHFISSKLVQDDIHKLWEIECDGTDDLAMSIDDKGVEALWDREVKLVDGHYQLPIPWKEGVSLPSNIGVAMVRLNALHKKLVKCDMLNRYHAEIVKMLQEGYAEFVPVVDIKKSDGVWYLPHHAVVNEKKPEKVRIVFDCAARFQGESLNNKCHQGPDYINRLLSVLLRFRQHSYAVTADVQAMYYQVKIPPEQRDSLRFLWYDSSGTLVHYRMTGHVFGGIWCSSSTTYALRHTIQDFEASSLVADAVLRNFYVDDLLCSLQTEQEALEVIEGVPELLSKAGFRLTKFVVSDPKLLDHVPEEDRAGGVKVFESEYYSRALGVEWDVVNDELVYSEFKFDSVDKVTRRSMLRAVASLYDPLGVIGPFIVIGKILLQEATRLKLSWDEEVPPDLTCKWLSWIEFMKELPLIRIPRCVKPFSSDQAVMELHHFCDASEVAYGSCSYLRCARQDGSITTFLVFSKAKVAPIKSVGIPRLELQAAVLAAKVEAMLLSELDIALLPSRFWSDSEIVLKYINNSSRRFHTFVANRVSTICEVSDPSQWYHIPGSDNPADIISRGSKITSRNFDHWFHGPQFLRTHKSEWGTSSCELFLPADDPEVKKDVKSVTSCFVAVDSPTNKLLTYFSDWHKLKRAVGWFLRLKQVLRGKTHVTEKCLTVGELKEAETAVLRFVQHQFYGSEVKLLSAGTVIGKSSALRDLSPFLDDCGILRVGGRLRYSMLSSFHKYPVIVPNGHHVAQLLVLHYHNIAHLGTDWVVAQLRQKYWITKVRIVVKSIRHNCFKCKRLFNDPCSQRMADLPADRLQANKPPFTFVGVDCFGPTYVKQGRAQIKRYGCLYTCLTTRAVHLEVLYQMDTDSFINSFRRFVCRRGNPERVYSDQGTNLVGGHAELDTSIKQLDKARVITTFRSEGIDWVFIPPSAAHMGGVWERLVGVVKKAIIGVLDIGCSVNDEVLQTLFCEVERIVNSRPITKQSEDAGDLVPLSPNHLLLLRECPSLPPGIFCGADMYKRRWRIVQYLSDQFWSRWLREYLSELQKRNKWHNISRNLAEGDLVLISGENTPRGVWPMGIVQEVFEGKDGLVRSAKIKTKASLLVRPVVKCILLEECCK